MARRGWNKFTTLATDVLLNQLFEQNIGFVLRNLFALEYGLHNFVLLYFLLRRGGLFPVYKTNSKILVKELS